MWDGLLLIALGIALLALVPNAFGELPELERRVWRFNFPRARGIERVGAGAAYAQVVFGGLLGLAAIVGGVVLIVRG
jgi:hypothetical protein